MSTQAQELKRTRMLLVASKAKLGRMRRDALHLEATLAELIAEGEAERARHRALMAEVKGRTATILERLDGLLGPAEVTE